MIHFVAKNLTFRGWFYFRQGWSMYFAFLFAATNTLTVTYYLAIERYPFLHDLFPTFLHYVFIAIAIGIPLLATIGYVHYKKSPAYKSEVSVAYESNPWWRRMMVNSEITLNLNLKITQMLLKMQNDGKLSQNDIDEITKLQDELVKHTNERTFQNEKDHEYFKKHFTSL